MYNALTISPREKILILFFFSFFSILLSCILNTFKEVT